MRSVAIAVLPVASVCLAGCFYVDPIQRHRPVNLESDATRVPRGGSFQVTAVLDHPDLFEWHEFACAGDGTCVDFAHPAGRGEIYQTVTVQVPVHLTDEQSPLTESIRVEVVARDDRGVVAGGVAGGNSSETYAVDNALPSLQPRKEARSLTVGAPIDLFARYEDADDPVVNTRFTWEIVAPVLSPPIKLDSTLSTTGPGQITARTRLVPPEGGAWDVKVTATTPQDTSQEQHLMFEVLPDRPPCLVQSRPIVAPEGTALPITETTVFQVAVVDDDLDSYPRLSSDPLFGTAAFAWSILPPGAATRQLLVGATGNTIDFDPDAFAPGDIVELRVEIFDRKRSAVLCADDAATCSSESNGCLQRQTWRLEAR